MQTPHSESKSSIKQTLPRRAFMQVAVSAGLSSLSFSDEPSKIKKGPIKLKVGDPFPETILIDRNGEPLNLTDLQRDKHKDKLILVDFWGVWCPPCLKEIPALNQAYEQLKEQQFKSKKDGKVIAEGLEIYSIAIHTDQRQHHQAWLKFLDNNNKIKWKYNVEAPSGQYVFDRYGVSSIPRNFLLDQDGKILIINADPKSLKDLIQNLTP